MAHDVFISYASGDKAVADAVCTQLEAGHRIRCWIAPRDITPGASWAESIIDALDASKIMVLIFSNSANASMQIEREVERAVHKGINIIPLRIENATPTKTLEYFISAPHWLDALSVPLENHIEKLAVSVKALLAKPGPGGRIVSHDLLASTTPALPDALPSRSSPPAAPPQTAASTGPGRAQRPAVLVIGALAIAIAAAAASRFLIPSGSDVQPAPSTAPVREVSPGSPAPRAATAPAASATTAPAVVPPTSAAVNPAKPIQKPNLYVDFTSSVSEGTIVVNIDGQKKWSAPLAPPPAKPGTKPEEDDDRTIEQALSVPSGKHQVNVMLLRPNGDTRETETIEMTTDEAMPRTLRIRLSRFKRNLQLTSVAAPPPSDSQKPVARPEPEAVKVKKP